MTAADRFDRLQAPTCTFIDQLIATLSSNKHLRTEGISKCTGQSIAELFADSLISSHKAPS